MTVRRILLALVAAAAIVPASTQAVIPPTDCGRMTVSGKRYQVKADQVSCTAGRKNAKAYIVNRTKPRGFTCTRYPAKPNRVAFLCRDGAKNFFAIRR